MNVATTLNKAEKGFSTIPVNKKYITSALKNLEAWLTQPEFENYVPQIQHLVNKQDWDYLLDCFYQVIPFGTGGRRGEVGIGPNRINRWTIKSSAQGHSQYLIKKYGDEAKERGVVFTYDVRVFLKNAHLSNRLKNPVKGLDGRQLANAAAKVYAANGIKVFMFDDIRTTPQLSFAIRYLNAVAGDMFSASHNPPDHNGKKIYDEFGGQLIPPDDEALVNEVTQKVRKVKVMPFDEAVEKGLIEYVGEDVDNAFISEIRKNSLSKARDIKVVYTPLHGCGMTSVYKTLKAEGFNVKADPKTKKPSGAFEHVTFNIPNPEVIQSFDTTLKYAKRIKADIILSTDPDADRIGVMINHHGKWEFLNGNELGIILTEYALSRTRKPKKGKKIVIKTAVTSNLIAEISKTHNAQIIGDLLVGYKYIGAEMNKLEKEGKIDQCVFSCEESHGYLAGDYCRDKDAAVAGLWLAELAAELKKKNKTLLDYLNDLYSKYSYYRNYLTEIRLLGASGVERIHKIQTTMRESKPSSIGKYSVSKVEDMRDRKPILSDTDFISKNMLVFTIKPFKKIKKAKITLRPSGTEPKIKMYFELSARAKDFDSLDACKAYVEDEKTRLEKAYMLHCYNIIGVDFPMRGFLLFWQLPLDDKMKYFEIEDEIAALRDIPAQKRKKELSKMLTFLGSDPLDKINDAFEAKHGSTVTEFLEL